MELEDIANYVKFIGISATALFCTYKIVQARMREIKYQETEKGKSTGEKGFFYHEV